MLRCAAFFAVVVLAGSLAGQAPEKVRTAREALQPFGDLVGTWRGTGVPAGSREEQNKNFWQESITCEWKFKDADAWLVFAFDKSKHFKTGELRFISAKNHYQLRLLTADKKSLELVGNLQGKNLILDHEDGSQRIVITVLHDNRFLYRHDIRPAGKNLFTKAFQVGATKEGVPFAIGSGQPECIVTGGLGTSTVMYLGKTYYVCCSGCRDEFLANPAKYVQESESKKAKK